MLTFLRAPTGWSFLRLRAALDHGGPPPSPRHLPASGLLAAFVLGGSALVFLGVPHHLHLAYGGHGGLPREGPAARALLLLLFLVFVLILAGLGGRLPLGVAATMPPRAAGAFGVAVHLSSGPCVDSTAS